MSDQPNTSLRLIYRRRPKGDAPIREQILAAPNLGDRYELSPGWVMEVTDAWPRWRRFGFQLVRARHVGPGESFFANLSPKGA